MTQRLRLSRASKWPRSWPAMQAISSAVQALITELEAISLGANTPTSATIGDGDSTAKA